jgi:hypothetical protein
VQAYFLVANENDWARTQFILRDYPEIEMWLLSIVDHLDYKLGKLIEERRIADPPGGTAGKLLIKGGVLLADQQPGHGLALRLNTTCEMGLQICARVRGGPAVDVAVALGEDLELSRWLLTHGSGSRSAIDQALASDTLLASLRRYGVLVEELPPEDACFPDPQAPVDLAGELAPVSRVYYQPAGENIPIEVHQMLGGYKPPLPPNTSFLWGQDAGTGIVYPTVWNGGREQQRELERITGLHAPERAAHWKLQRESAHQSLHSRKYAVLREIVPPAQRAKLRQYVRQLVERGYFTNLGVDTQVALRSSIHKQETMASLHRGLAGLLSSIADQPLIGSFCQLGLYYAGAVLERHTDRPQCVLNLSLVIDMDGPGGDPDPWPVYLSVGGETVSVELQIGDGLVYSGVEIEHWRDALPAGQRAIVGFFFFVPPDFKGTLN